MFIQKNPKIAENIAELRNGKNIFILCIGKINKNHIKKRMRKCIARFLQLCMTEFKQMFFEIRSVKKTSFCRALMRKMIILFSKKSP